MVYGTDLRLGKRELPPCPRTRCPRTSAITRSAAASRRCTSDSKRPVRQPALTGAALSTGWLPKNPPALLVEALNEPVVVTIDGGRREITGQGFAEFGP